MTTDTQLAPPDAEIVALMGDPRYSTIGAVREAISRWGRSAHRGEPVAELHVDRFTTAVKALQGAHDVRPYGKHSLYTAPQPVEREHLTDEQIDRAIAELGLNYLADAHATNRAVLRKLCHHAHGIKGGQHGADT